MNSAKNDIGKPMVINTVCALLILVGAYFWFRGYTGKPGATDLNQDTTWGLYIALFLFFEAIGAGALFIAAMNKEAKCRLRLAILGTVCVLGAGLAIMLDLGDIFTTWRLFFAPNILSPMLLDVWFVLLSIICGVFLIMSISKGSKSPVIPVLTAALAVLLPLGTAILFTSLPGRIGWGSSLEIAVFLAQAALAGICCLVFFAKDYAKIAKWVAGLFLINLVLASAEILLAVYQSSIESIPLMTLMKGEYAGLFWLWIIGGLVIPLALSFKAKYPVATVCLGLFGILASKILFVVKGNMYPFLRAGEGIQIDVLEAGLNGYQKVPTYIPGMEELLVGLAAFAFILIAYNLLSNVYAKSEVCSPAISPDKGIGS